MVRIKLYNMRVFKDALYYFDDVTSDIIMITKTDVRAKRQDRSSYIMSSMPTLFQPIWVHYDIYAAKQVHTIQNTFEQHQNVLEYSVDIHIYDVRIKL